VQTTLLGLAIAIILALVSALVAPLVVDWNRYRSDFEQEASRVTGIAVRVRGTIDVRILPSPRIKLRDVEVGAPGRQPQMRAGAIELEVGLSPLLRGEVQATELRLVAPQISLGLDRSGMIDWPTVMPSLRAEALSISRLNVVDGRVVLTDAASGSRLVLQKLWFDGDVRSVIGPFRGEGAFVAGDELYGYRISGSRYDEDAGLKLRLGVDPSNHPLTTEIEGTLKFDRDLPQFDGTLAVARPVGATLARGERVMSDPFHLTGKVHLTPASAALQDLALQYGPDERAINFNAKAEVTFGPHPHLAGALSARQVDVDRALAAPDITHRPPLVMIKSFVEGFVAAARPPLPLAVDIAVDAVTVGGTTIQALAGNVSFDDEGWSLRDLAFRAPGFTQASLSGRLAHSPQGLAFSGPATLESADLNALMAWLEGRGGDQPSASSETLTARADLTIASDRFALDRLAAALDQEKVEGRLAYTWAANDRPATLDGELHAPTLNVDALTAFAKAAASDRGLQIPRQVALVLDVGKATFAGVDARRVNARVKFDQGILHIDRLSVGDLGGAALDVSGRIDELSSQPRGRLTLDLDAGTLGGLTHILGRTMPRLADAIGPFAERLAPAKVHGVLTVDRAGAAGTSAKLDVGGDLGAIRVAVNGEASGDPAHPAAAVVRLAGRLDADDGGALVRLLGLAGILAVDQLPGQIAISASGPLDGDLHVNGLAAAGGLSAVAEGVLQVAGDQAPTGSLQVKASAADLRPLLRASMGQPGGAVPVSARATVGLARAALSFNDLTMTAGKSSLHGRLDVKLADRLGVAGDIQADDVDAAAVLAMLLGLPGAAPNASRLWSAEPIGSGAFAVADGSVAFKIDHAAFSSALAVRDLKGVVRLQPSAIVLGDLDGNFAGGRLGGELTFRHDAFGLAMRGRAELVGANTSTMIAAKKNRIDGQLTVKLQAEGSGLSPDGLIGSLHGSGIIALHGGRFGGIDAASFDAAMRAADQSGSIEPAKIRAAVAAAMENGALAVPHGEAEVTIAAGQIRLTHAVLAADGGAALTLDGVLDLSTAALDADMKLSAQPAANALITLPAELAVAVKGPLTAPERTIDVSTLVSWLTLRATELQTRRLESVEANRRTEAAAFLLRPPSPPIRFLPSGTAVETANRTKTTGGAPDARGFDRLRPDIPADAQTSHAEEDNAATAALPSPSASKPAVPRPSSGAAQSAPRSLLPNPLDLLFRSQN
jgi:uncharacterized protein involved in outer membrane biogenesis